MSEPEGSRRSSAVNRLSSHGALPEFSGNEPEWVAMSRSGAPSGTDETDIPCLSAPRPQGSRTSIGSSVTIVEVRLADWVADCVSSITTGALTSMAVFVSPICMVKSTLEAGSATQALTRADCQGRLGAATSLDIAVGIRYKSVTMMVAQRVSPTD